MAISYFRAGEGSSGLMEDAGPVWRFYDWIEKAMRIRRFLPDLFVSMMLFVVAFAFLVPWPAADDAAIDLSFCTKVGIALIFFLHGANLEPQKLLHSVRKWKAHSVSQSVTFIVFPLLGLILFFGTSQMLSPELRLGMFFLTALPSTVSSSIALTAMGKGNVPVAVFNATLSSLLGLVLTPLLIAMVSSTAVGSFSPVDSMIDIARVLLLPFAIGQISRPVLKGFLSKYKAFVGRIDRGVILLIIYVAFAKAKLGGIWSEFSPEYLIVIFMLMVGLFCLGIGCCILLARFAGLPTDEEVATVFCGTTKSLANGAPIAQILFHGSPQLGIIMLPLLLYHQFQLITCAIIAQRYARRIGTTEADQFA